MKGDAVEEDKEKGKEKEEDAVARNEFPEDKENFGDFDRAKIEEAAKDKEGDEAEEISEPEIEKLEISDEEELQPKLEAWERLFIVLSLTEL
ncbi:hypothetical protein JCGZ_12937 [Jatropha curcas]|uniref:Uncharacterized protein n=1 Tax=Jatropha curcas TaxID=180498 RepID=A0A067LPJ9_JATCU|nr:hypothetical protein JCGZ_12937 [Jatropha curcas]